MERRAPRGRNRRQRGAVTAPGGDSGGGDGRGCGDSAGRRAAGVGDGEVSVTSAGSATARPPGQRRGWGGAAPGRWLWNRSAICLRLLELLQGFTARVLPIGTPVG